MAAGDLTTLANVKDWLGILSSDTSQDARLSRLITAASARTVGFLGRSLVSTAFSETYDGSGTQRLALRNYPVTAISSLTVDGAVVPAAAVTAGSPPSNGYVITNQGSPITTGALIVVYGFAFSNPFAASGVFGRSLTTGIQNVAISYTAGYATVPADVEQAIIEFVQTLSQRQSLDANVAAESTSGVGSVTYRQGAGQSAGGMALVLPENVQLALLPYRRVL